MLREAEVEHELAREEFEGRVPKLRVELINAQFDLQRADFPVILLLAGDDRLGQNDTLERLYEWMDARYLKTHALRPRTEEEREQPFMWRYWRRLPRDGQFAIFVGGWAGEGIVPRLRKEVGKRRFERWLTAVESFESELVDDGALLIKVWLHVPKKVHKQRMQRARKRRRLRVDERELSAFDDYEKALELCERMLLRTHTAAAPWHLVDGRNEDYRDLRVAELVLANLTARLASKGPASSPVPREPLGPLPPGSPLAAVDLGAALSPQRYERELDRLQDEIERLTARAQRAGRTSVVAFEGWDAAGKGGCIRRLTGAMDARDYQIVPISAPTEEERAHHYLWRFWMQLPQAGQLGVFDRSWYGRVLVERVEGFAREEEWKRAYGEIVDFEAQLAWHGITLLKFFMHITPEEQLARFAAREETAYKKYKITAEDYRNRQKWDRYLPAVDEMLLRTSTPAAPWHVVSAMDKRWARIQVLKTVARALRKAL